MKQVKPKGKATDGPKPSTPKPKAVRGIFGPTPTTYTLIHQFPPGTFSSVTVHDLEALEARIVSALSDKIAEATAKVDAATARVQTDVASLRQQIADLQAKIDAGGGTQADIDALQALEDKVDALDQAAPPTP